ncbi:response regulator [Cellulomonas edaphi]|uniref:Response regulator n=1 Tax=Cellulomonas edaphi TaxID=3053468 RepID=A0ABT7S5T3_9CELL|nr:response regulator [Cellulomons edaphi]MDM7830984.1 response regulator [Cellulomons edaphi]
MPLTLPALSVLVVEDDPGDQLLIREVFEEHSAIDALTIVDDGAAALAYLRREGEYVDAPRPTLMLLDLNLPLRSGGEVLEQVRAETAWRALPVVILTTSDEEVDVARAYAAGANAYITKPLHWDEFAAKVRKLDEFYLRTARLPRHLTLGEHEARRTSGPGDAPRGDGGA